MRPFMDLTGQKFGRLTAIKRVESRVKADGKRVTRWECKCDCGRIVIANAATLRNGRSKSCGCLQKETAGEVGKRYNTKHGGTKERLYRVWQDMIRRCENPKDNRYEYYGGKGIKVCEEWRHSYQAFRDFAFRSGYDESAERGECTIDRIDTNKDYCPENCRWADKYTQSNNKSNNIYITCLGKTMTIAQWSREIGISVSTLYQRHRSGWSDEKIVSTPLLR